MTLWLVRSGTGQHSHGPHINLDLETCPTVMAEGLGGGNCSQYWLEHDAMSTQKAFGMPKPSYRVPLMTEIAALPWNGLTVASTFSGCGGSSLGYHLAGFRVVWANEFVPAAQACYRANFPETVLDTRDIRDIQARDMLAATGLAAGDLDILDGSPPCQAFSMAGKRARGWGQEKHYEHGAHQKNETLFTEYVRFVRDVQPKVFLAENVSGLIKGVAKGFFKEILRDLKACGYVVEARLLDAQWLGVPQMRQRIIFQGVRMDLGRQPAWPSPLPYRYSVRDALPWLVSQARANNVYEDASVQDARTVMATTGRRTSSTLSGEHLSYVEARVMDDTSGFVRNKDVTDQPCPAITNGIEGLNNYHYQVVWDDSYASAKADVTASPAPTVRSGRAGTLFLEGANGYNGHAGSSLEQPMPTVQAGRPVQDLHRPDAPRTFRDGRGAFGDAGEITNRPSPPGLAGSIGTHWIEETRTTIVHPSGFGKGHEDSVDHPLPTVMVRPEGIEGMGPGQSFLQVGTQRRKFTIGELKRICAFPDDFVLVGSYAQQWERLGNAVPPVMMYHLAIAVRDSVLLA